MELGKNSVSKNEDLELLAALIDGRLSADERVRALSLLANSDEALELFASTVREQPKPEPSVVPIFAARRWRHWRVTLPVAAAAVLAAVLPRLVSFGGSPELALQFATDVTRLPSATGMVGVQLSSGWDGHGLTVTRGARGRPPIDAASDRATAKLAFRLGVRSVDLQVALLTGDTATARHATDDVFATLGDIPLSQAVADDYNTIRENLGKDAREQSIDRASKAERALRALLHDSSFVFAQWVGAADVAAQAGNAAFFESKHGLPFIRSTLRSTGLVREDTEALARIDARMSQGMEAVHDELLQIIKSRAG